MIQQPPRNQAHKHSGHSVGSSVSESRENAGLGCTRPLDHEKIWLGVIDHGYNPATSKILACDTFGAALIAAYQERTPHLFTNFGPVTISFYDREGLLTDSTKVNDLMLEVMPAAKALIFRGLGTSRALLDVKSKGDDTSEKSFWDDTGKKRLPAAVAVYQETLLGVIDHPNESDRVSLHQHFPQGVLHIGDPKRKMLAHLELVDHLSSNDCLHFVLRSNRDNSVLRRFSLQFNSQALEIQKLDPFDGYQAGFYEYSNVKFPQKRQSDIYNKSRIGHGLRLIGEQLQLVPENFDKTRPEIAKTWAGQEFLQSEVGTPVMRFRHHTTGAEMLVRVRNPLSYYSQVQQLFIGPEGAKNKMRQLVKTINRNFPSECDCRQPDKLPTLEVITDGESMLLTYDISRTVFDQLGA